ncbi:hypothetical protein [Jannaschia aquimarina]|uniref:hypothetical protein n=1 Tax=Jannaschia aquimarina TaxID=935700 RepID=UPI0005C6A192|nr:hypothetical protein [Jannaschia aquimarina]
MGAAVALMLAGPAAAQEAGTCQSITSNVRYCAAEGAMLLGAAEPGEGAVGGPMPHIRAWYSNETDPFSGIMILAIPVTIAPGATVEPSNLYAVVRDTTDADGWEPGTFQDEWMAASDVMDGKVAVVGEFRGNAPTPGYGTNYVFDAWLDDRTIVAVMTIDDQKGVTQALRDQHRVTREGLQVRP